MSTPRRDLVGEREAVRSAGSGSAPHWCSASGLDAKVAELVAMRRNRSRDREPVAGVREESARTPTLLDAHHSRLTQCDGNRRGPSTL